MIKELVTHIVKQLVAHPDSVNVSEIAAEGKDLLEIAVHESDRGKVIGRDGQTIKAIRMIVNALTPADRKISVDVAK